MIEFALVTLDPAILGVVDKHDALINLECGIDTGATATNGITQSMLAPQPIFADVNASAS